MKTLDPKRDEELPPVPANLEPPRRHDEATLWTQVMKIARHLREIGFVAK